MTAVSLRLLALAATLAILSGSGASAAPPAVSRVRIPAEKLSEVFPPGTEYRVMPADQFEQLLRDAGGVNDPPRPRLLRVDHVVRWVEGTLVGRSDLVVRAESQPGELLLDPWTPAVVRAEAERIRLVSGGDGKTRLRVAAGAAGRNETAVVDWELNARPGTDGRRFVLKFPEVGGIFSLDLPARFEPVGLSGVREGPMPSDDSSRRRWTFRGVFSEANLVLVDPTEAGDVSVDSGIWFEGKTSVLIGESSASWTLEGLVHAGPLAARVLELELPTGVEPTGVSGAAVEGFRSEPRPDGTRRLTVRLARPRTKNAATEDIQLVVQGIAPVPIEGAWTIPSARPLNAIWTAGVTTVRVEPPRVVASVRPRNGVRTTEFANDTAIAFSALRPEPVADLVFARPRVEVSAAVRGDVFLGNAAPRFTAAVTYRVYRGKPLELDLDLPRAWTADKVTIEGVDEPISWHADSVEGSGSRLRIRSPSGDWPERSLVVNVAATSTVVGGRGPLALPRIRPVGVRVVDELWSARVEPGFTLVPTVARGLAWVDTSVTSDVDPERPTLAWRWTSLDGEGTIDRTRVRSKPVASIETVASLGPSRLSVEARARILAHEMPLRRVIVGLSEPVDNPSAWRAFDAAGGSELPLTPIPLQEAGETRALGRGPAWSLVPPKLAPGPFEFFLRYDGPWKGAGRIPVALLADPPSNAGRLRILTKPGAHATLSVQAMTRLDSSADEDLPGAEAARGVNDEPTSQIYAYSGPDGVAEARIEGQADSRGPGLVRSALLSTRVETVGPIRHRLSLSFLPRQATGIDLTLPADLTLEAVRRGGHPVIASIEGARISIPVGASDSGGSVVDFELDFRSQTLMHGGSVLVRPPLLQFSAPCLAFAWELSTPEPWRLADFDPSLTPSDESTPPKSWVERLSTGAWPRAFRSAVAEPTASIEKLLLEAETKAGSSVVVPSDLGGWASLWDLGPTPLLIDRPRLEAQCVRPATRMTHPKEMDGGSDWRAEALKRLGLQVATVGRNLLITTRSEAERGDIKGRAVAAAEAAIWGVDSVGRFSSVDRWRGEPSARSISGVPTLATEQAGRTVVRFVAKGLPTSNAFVRFADGRRQTAAAWAAALAVLVSALLLRRTRSPVRATAATSALALALLFLVAGPLAYVVIARGLVGGALAAAALMLGDSIVRRGGTTSPASPSPSTFRRLAYFGPTAMVVQGVISLTGGWSLAQTPPILDLSPIVAVFPYEGDPEPSRRPDRALLKLSDFERLRRFADEQKEDPKSTLYAADVLHRVRPGKGGRLSVETTWNLLGEGAGPARWVFPVSGGKDISATIDGEIVPVRIEPGGSLASVDLSLKTPSDSVLVPIQTLVVRRTIETDGVGDGPRATLSITPAADARLEVNADEPGVFPEILSARGGIEKDPAGNLKVRIGPVDHLALRWRARGEARKASPPVGEVDMLVLWDAVPSGDRLRARLTYRNPAGTSVAKVALGPGLLLRNSTLPTGGDAVIESHDGRSEWVGRFDPPLPDGSTLALDLWRPRAAGLAEGVAPRTMPELTPIGVERASGRVALRRPSAWLGRLGKGPDEVAGSEEGFVRAWGALPDASLTLSGAAKIETSPSPSPWPEVSIGAVPAGFLIRNDVAVSINPGRLDAVVDATLSPLPSSTPGDEAVAVLPPGIRVVDVAGDGLGFWQDSEDDHTARTIRFRFDGAPRSARRIRITGWLPVKYDPLDPQSLGREVAVPWPVWVGQATTPGQLTVSSPVRVDLQDSTGVTEEPATPTSTGRAPATGSAFRTAYRVAQTASLGRLRWRAEPAAAAVQLQNQLVIRPESAEWLAVVRYEVAGGTLDAINLKVSADWARNASVELEGVGHKLVTDVQDGVTYWSVRPERPVLGRQRLVVRSTLPFVPGQTLAYPELSPLGRNGRVDAYLRIIPETRQPLSIENPTGVLLTDSPVPDLEDELSLARRGGQPVTTYRVVRPGWSLSLVKLAPKPPSDLHDDFASVTLIASADGSALGFGHYLVAPREGGVIDVRLPEGVELIDVSADGRPSSPLRVADRLLEVPVSGGKFTRLSMVWSQAAPARALAARLVLPFVGEGRTEVALVVRSPQGATVRATGVGLASTSADQLRLASASRAERDVVGLLAKSDGRIRRDVDRLVDLIGYARIALREAARAVACDFVLDPGQNQRRAMLVRNASDAFEARIERALTGADSGDVVRASLRGTTSDLKPTEIGEPPALLGRHQAFAGTVDSSVPLAVTVVLPPSGAFAPERTIGFGLLAIGILAPLIAWEVSRRARGSTALEGTSLVALSAGAAIASGPMALAIVLGLASVGALARAWSGVPASS